ncbi:MAG: efflux system, outer rane lipoprotein NodT family [Pedosphaera sp.]|nr:efflux system, outer rane lipoprotein NodT family [Pedosphaera sp.]
MELSRKERHLGIAAIGVRLGISGFGLCILLIAGCAVGPNYRRPALNPPPVFRGEMQAATNSFADLPWWQIFHDDTLQELIRIALTNNYDLRVAVSRVEQAHAVMIETRSQLLPQINYTGLGITEKNISTSGALFSSATTSGGLNTTTASSGRTTFYLGDLNTTWEIDLWGRIRRLTESDRAQYFSSIEARRNVTISLIAQVAQDYFQLLALDRELAIARETTNSYGDSLKIFDQRLRGGVASKLETSSAEALLYATAATIPDLERQIALQENALSYLLGLYPGAIRRDHSRLLNESLPDVPAGLPSALLERRPDIREAEQQLRSANAQVGVAVGNFFPQLTLTGLFGQVSPTLSAFSGGGVNAWNAAANLTGPIFQGGKLKAQYHQAKALRDQYVWQYRGAVLTAFQEVSSSLVAREKYAAERIQQARAVEAYREATKVSLQRYRLGESSYYEVLQEQQLLFPAENTLVQIELNQLVTVVQLYLQLGGGWETGPQP